LGCGNSTLRHPAHKCTPFFRYTGKFFPRIHISNIRVSMTQVNLFLLRSLASLRTSVINLYTESHSATYFSVS
jgi:hypothetical protein